MADLTVSPADHRDNPCIFKRECKECKLTGILDRPLMCVDLQCEHYTPCTRCKKNRTLDPAGLCNVCVKKGRLQETVNADGAVVEVAEGSRALVENIADLGDGDIIQRTLRLTQPGTPPPEFAQEEKEYYLGMWDRYQQYYRDPTAMSVCHTIVILEVELQYQLNWMAIHRSEVNKERLSARTRLIRTLKELRDQLPKKEALEESDDEKFLSMIYEKYVEEKAKMCIGKVTRLLTPEALALAPSLHFPINPLELLKDCGYQTISAVEAVNHITVNDLPSDPKIVLEFFGYFLDERYAMALNPDIQQEEEALPLIAHVANAAPLQSELDELES